MIMQEIQDTSSNSKIQRILLGRPSLPSKEGKNTDPISAALQLKVQWRPSLRQVTYLCAAGSVRSQGSLYTKGENKIFSGLSAFRSLRNYD